MWEQAAIVQTNYYADPKNVFGYSSDSRLGTAIGLLSGNIQYLSLTDTQCRHLGYEEEIRKYDNKEVTAETVRRLSTEAEARRKAEHLIGTVFVNLMHKCEGLYARMSHLENRIMELEDTEALTSNDKGI